MYPGKCFGTQKNFPLCLKVLNIKKKKDEYWMGKEFKKNEYDTPDFFLLPMLAASPSLLCGLCRSRQSSQETFRTSFALQLYVPYLYVCQRIYICGIRSAPTSSENPYPDGIPTIQIPRRTPRLQKSHTELDHCLGKKYNYYSFFSSPDSLVNPSLRPPLHLTFAK